MQAPKVLITPQFEAHFSKFARNVFGQAACPPSHKVVPSHDKDTEVIVEYLEDQGRNTAYCTTCRQPEESLPVSYISLCGMDNNQPIVLAQFDSLSEYRQYFQALPATFSA